MFPIENTENKNINQLGIVAGLIDEIGIFEIISYKLGIDYRDKIVLRILVIAIFINALEFVSINLYLFIHFFDDIDDKGIKMLLGEDVKID
ncbi:Transposase [Richelia intracellularis]|nr:Transposase [Richelia intracellularis]